MNPSSNADQHEIDKFGEAAHRWWDPNSEFRPLHDINPARLGWIDRNAGLTGLQVIDVGCGGGLLSEGMAAMGAQVTGVDLSGSKIGGRVDGSVLLLPDPMGATGKTTVRALEHYHKHYGKPAKIVALPMIATPEYLRNVLEAYDNLVIYTARLDRGMSDPDVLATMPGTHWDRERGLDEKSYIVPGAGGMGEVINNSWC